MLLLKATYNLLKKKTEALEKHLDDDLKREINQKTGGDNWHNPAKVLRESKEQSLEEIKRIVQNAEIIDQPESKEKVKLGHKVTVKLNSDKLQNKNIIFHIGTEIDAKYLGSKENSNKERIVSQTSPVGNKIINSKIDEKVRVNSQEYKILEIRPSKYLD